MCSPYSSIQSARCTDITAVPYSVQFLSEAEAEAEEKDNLCHRLYGSSSDSIVVMKFMECLLHEANNECCV